MLLESIEKKLHSEVQGTCTGQYGFIVAVLEVIDVGPCIVLPGNGQAEFKTRYKAIVFKPFRGEVLDAVVAHVLQVRVYYLRSAPSRTELCYRQGFSLMLDH